MSVYPSSGHCRFQVQERKKGSDYWVRIVEVPILIHKGHPWRRVMVTSSYLAICLKVEVRQVRSEEDRHPKLFSQKRILIIEHEFSQIVFIINCVFFENMFIFYFVLLVESGWHFSSLDAPPPHFNLPLLKKLSGAATAPQHWKEETRVEWLYAYMCEIYAYLM